MREGETGKIKQLKIDRFTKLNYVKCVMLIEKCKINKFLKFPTQAKTCILSNIQKTRGVLEKVERQTRQRERKTGVWDRQKSGTETGTDKAILNLIERDRQETDTDRLNLIE